MEILLHWHAGTWPRSVRDSYFYCINSLFLFLTDNKQHLKLSLTSIWSMNVQQNCTLQPLVDKTYMKCCVLRRWKIPYSRPALQKIFVSSSTQETWGLLLQCELMIDDFLFCLSLSGAIGVADLAAINLPLFSPKPFIPRWYLSRQSVRM